MAATLDKDTIVKHGFWILAGCYVVLVLACLTVLATSVSSAVQEEEAKLEKTKATVTGITNPKNDKWVQAYKKQDDKINGKKDEVWGKAWKTQEDMMTWPRELQARFQKYKYFGDPIDDQDRYSFDEKYNTQFNEVLDVVQPVKSKDEGVVQCKASSWWELLALDQNFATKPPTKDDIWLTQEELWVKRELLRILREANDSVARFKEVVPESATQKEEKPAKTETAAPDKDPKAAKPSPPATKTDPNHKIFRNPYWELDLTLSTSEQGKSVLRGKITNCGRRKQVLDTKIKVFLQDPRTTADPSYEPITLAALPLAKGESMEIPPREVPQQKTIEGLFGAEQVLNWRTAAVKRLDDLRLMYMSSRTMRELKPPRFLAAPAEGSDSAGGDTSAQAGGTPSPGVPSSGPPGPSFGGGASLDATVTLNGLVKNRYTDVSEQVRHMPVAMVVVVDEDHLPELLAAFVNSKLHVQITQYHWQHCREHMNPALNDMNQQFAPSAPISSQRMPGPGMRMGGKEMMTPLPRGYRPSGVSGMMPARGERERTQMPGPPMGRPPMASVPGGGRPFGPGAPGYTRGTVGSGSDSEDEEQEDLNLLEVAVYGLASLYERYPPAPPKPAEPSGTPEEKQPAANTTGGK